MMPKVINPLTSIRFFAAFYVVFHHFGAQLIPQNWTLMEIFRSRGGAGVSLFFILSGFVLALNYAQRDAVSAREFLVMRLARIYPAYIVSLLIALPMFAKLTVSEHGQILGVILVLGQVLLCTFLLQAWMPKVASILNPPGWSLSAEWFFYSVFPFLLKSTRWIRFLRNASVSVAILWVVSLAVSFLTPYVLKAYTPWMVDATTVKLLLAFNPLVRLPEFMIGIALGLYYLDQPRWKCGGTVAILVGLTIVAVLFLLPITSIELSLHTSLLAPLFGVLILSIAYSEGVVARFLSLPSLVFLGEASYGLYILHDPVRVWMGWGFDKLGLHGIDEAWKAVGMIVVSIAAASISFLYIETPLRPIIRNKLSPKRGDSAGHK